MRNKKVWSGMLIAAMMVSACVPTMALTPSPSKDLKWEFAPSEHRLDLANDPRVAALSADTEIRIMVEVEEMAVIDYALQRGVTLSELDAATAEEAAEEVEDTLEAVKEDIVDESLDVTYLDEFANVFSGFSAVTTVEDAKAIEKLPNVKRVYYSTQYFLPTPQMSTSTDMINAGKAWDLKFKGEGMLIAVLDSSFAPDHPDMQLISNPSKAKYQSPDQLPAGLPGEWQNIKMPYAYNYYDNTQHLAATSEHGTHVAGTVAANGDVDNGGIRGVAPEAQLLGMKVFGDDPNMPSTFDDIYVRAIEDALLLGADGINMSLGSTAGFVQDESDDPARVAIRKAAESGVIVAISAGNSDRFGNGADEPYAINPDTGVVGSPSLNPYSLSVASMENTHSKMPFAQVATSGSSVQIQLPYNAVEGAPDPASVSSGHAIELAYVGTGEPKYYEGQNVQGKFVLAVRTGSYYYANIKATAQANGAAGILVRGTEAHGDYVSMNAGDTPTIPMMSLSIANGNKLEALLKAGESLSVAFAGEVESFPNGAAGQMSDFTSWGVTPDLEFKPEITAPGGRIYSTLQNGQHGEMSGTSMAAPHVAGATAVVMQRIEAEFGGLSGLDKYNFAKNLLMSTAKPVQVAGEVTYTSPRRQGAGLMDLYAATVGHVIATDANTGMSKVNLKEIGNSASFTVELKNFADKEVSYNLSASIGTDLVKDGYLMDAPDAITGTGIHFEKDGAAISSITVPTGGSITFDVSFNLEDAKLQTSGLPLKEAYVNGNFVEGFVRLSSLDDEEPSIGLPYLGFYGDWNDAPIIDTGDDKGLSFYGIPTSLFDNNYEPFDVIEGDPFTYFSPKDNQGEGDDVYDEVRAALTFLRNAKAFEINILDANKKVVKTLAINSGIRKNYYDGDSNNPVVYAEDEWVWDGKLDGKVAEGTYYYEIKAKIDFPGAEWQTYTIPLKIDMTAPIMNSVTYDEETMKLTLKGTDNLKLHKYAIRIGGKVYESFNGVFDLSKLVKGPTTVIVMVLDAAYNVDGGGIVVGDTKAPVLDMPSPEPLSTVNSQNVQFAGTIKDDHLLRSLRINNQSVPFAFDPEKGVNTFNTTIKLADGKHNVPIVAEDQSGNIMEFARIIYVDSSAPTIELDKTMAVKVPKEQTTFNLKAKFVDNYTGFIIKVNDSVEKNMIIDTTFIKTPAPVTYSMNRTVNLAPGDNLFSISAKDGAGNLKVVNYKVIRGESSATIESVKTEAWPLELISSERPVEISMSADLPLNWTVNVKSPTGQVVATENYAGSQHSFTWAPDAMNKQNGIYTAEISYTDGVAKGSKLIAFEVYNYPVKVSSVETVKRGNLMNVETVVKNLSESTQNPLLVVQVMDASGRVVNISSTQLKNVAPGKEVQMGAGFTLSSSGTYTVDVFVWNGWEMPQSLSSPNQVKIKH